MKIEESPRFGIIQKLIIFTAIFCMTIVWPAGKFPVNQISESNLEDSTITPAADADAAFRQEFSLMFDEVNSISVYLTNESETLDSMLAAFRIYNTSGICLQETLFQADEYTLPGYVSIPITVDLTAGTTYFFTIQGLDNELFASFSTEDDKAPELGQLLYKEVASPGRFLGTKFEYTRPMGMKRILFSYGLIAGAAFLVMVLFAMIRSRISEAKYRETEEWIKRGAFVLIGGIEAFCLYQIAVRKVFSSDTLNIVILAAATLLTTLLCIYFVCKSKSEYVPLIQGEKNKKQLVISWVRNVLWAASIIMVCRNNNAGTDYEKGLHLRVTFTLICLLIVSYSSAKEIFNLPNLLFSVVALVSSHFYVEAHSTHIEHINTAIRTCFAAWGFGLVVINFIYAFIQKKYKNLKQISLPYMILVYAFWIVCIVFGRGREWPAFILILYTLWNIKFFLSDRKRAMMEDLCNGILFALAGTVLFCLYRRAYQYYMLTRYAGIYFTVTATAVYLCVPVCAAFTKLMDIWKVGWKKRVLELFLVGMAFSYMLFTISRTGLITVAVIAVFALFFLYKGSKKYYFGARLKGAFATVISCLLCVVMFFGLTRMIPAVNKNPFYFFFEKDWTFVSEKTAMDGPEYITFQRFGEMVVGRLLGINGFYKEETEEVLGVAQAVDATQAAEEISQEDIFEMSVPLASEVPQPQMQEPSSDYSNGRIDIYRLYLKEIGMRGHEAAHLTKDDGEIIMHAHNTYLQTVYDFGLPIGILFAVFCLFTFVRAARLAYLKGGENKYLCLPLLVVVAFGVASMFELVYLPSIPLGFIFLFMIAPLLVKKGVWETEASSC